MLLCVSADLAQAQGLDVIHCTDSTFCVPSVWGMPRSKALIFEYENVFSHRLRATSDLEAVGNGSGELQREERLDFKLRFPIYLSESFKMALGFSYFNEDYIFKDFDNPDYALFQSLDDKNLKSMGMALYLTKAWKGKHYFIMRISTDLNGDYKAGVLPRDRYLRVSIAPMFGVKKDAWTSYGGGIAWGYNFGRPTIYPFFFYNRTFNDKLGIESILPANAMLRVNFSQSMILYSGVALEGSSYTIRPSGEALAQFETLQLRKSEIRLFANLEREIHDWFWFNVEAGVRFSYRFELAENLLYNPETIIDMRRRPAPFLKAGVFLVPPKKFLE